MNGAKTAVNPIRAARRRLGWTQGELAERSGISRVSVNAAESGRTIPQPGTIKKLAAALGVPEKEITPPRPKSIAERRAERERWIVRGLLDEVEAGTLSAHDAMQELRNMGILQPRKEDQGEKAGIATTPHATMGT